MFDNINSSKTIVYKNNILFKIMTKKCLKRNVLKKRTLIMI
jgi:hypothetical protein